MSYSNQVTPRRMTVILLSGLALLVAIAAMSPATAEAKGCGIASASNGHGSFSPFRVEAKRLNCGKAKSVIRRAWRSGKMMSPGSRVRVGSFNCRQVTYYEGGNLAIRCSSGKRLAKGYWTNENEG